MPRASFSLHTAFGPQLFLPFVARRLRTTRTRRRYHRLFSILIANHYFCQPLPKPLPQDKHLILNRRQFRSLHLLFPIQEFLMMARALASNLARFCSRVCFIVILHPLLYHPAPFPTRPRALNLQHTPSPALPASPGASPAPLARASSTGVKPAFAKSAYEIAGQWPAGQPAPPCRSSAGKTTFGGPR